MKPPNSAPVKQAVGFRPFCGAHASESSVREESGGSNLWPTDSCAIRRQQVGVGPADRQPVGAGSACRVGSADICFPGIRKTEETSRLNLWRLVSCFTRRQQVAVGPADRQQVEPGPARPLPFPTRSRGSVLRGMHSWQASFGGCWETGWFQLNHEISRLQLPQTRRG